MCIFVHTLKTIITSFLKIFKSPKKYPKFLKNPLNNFSPYLIFNATKTLLNLGTNPLIWQHLSPPRVSTPVREMYGLHRVSVHDPIGSDLGRYS